MVAKSSPFEIVRNTDFTYCATHDSVLLYEVIATLLSFNMFSAINLSVQIHLALLVVCILQT
jgi:hypothetical protein